MATLQDCPFFCKGFTFMEIVLLNISSFTLKTHVCVYKNVCVGDCGTHSSSTAIQQALRVATLLLNNPRYLSLHKRGGSW